MDTRDKPQPETYRDYEIIPVFNFDNGKSDWNVFKCDAEYGSMYPCMTLEQVKESIDDLLNQ